MDFVNSTSNYIGLNRLTAPVAASNGQDGGVLGQEFAALMQQVTQSEPGQATAESSPVASFMRAHPNKASPDYTHLVSLLESHPAVEAAIDKVAEISGPNASLFTGAGGDMSADIRNLAAEIDRIGETGALKNFFKQHQNLVGFGSSNWFGSHHMGNAEYAAYQTIINDLVKPVPDQSWNTKVARYGFDPELTWRDPASGRGIGVGTDVGKTRAEKMGYFDASGELQITSIVAELPVYENAERFGIDLSGVGALAQKLADKQIKIEPGQIYTGSDAGLDFADVAQGGIAGGQPAASWELSQKAHLNWQNQQAAQAGMMPPSTVVRAALDNIEKTAAMIERYQSRASASAPVSAPAAAPAVGAAGSEVPVMQQQASGGAPAASGPAVVSTALSPALQAASMAQSVSPQLSLSSEMALLESMLSYGQPSY